MIFVYMLCGFHHKLMKLGMTTNEQYKNTYRNNQETPFTRFGYISNFIRCFTRRLSKPLLDKNLLYEKGHVVYNQKPNDPMIALDSNLQVAPTPSIPLKNSGRSINIPKNGIICNNLIDSINEYT